MIHVILASSLPLVAFLLLWWRRGRRATSRSLVVLPLTCLVSGAWAVVPDMPRLWGDRDGNFALHHLRYCDVWWLHCTIDRRDDIDSSMAFPALFITLTIMVFAIGWREVRRAERGDRRGAR